MKNYEANRKLKQLFKAKKKYQLLLKEVGEEIKKRHGCTPYDVDLETFIDTYIYSSNTEMSIEEIDAGMKECIERTERVDFLIEFE